MKTLTITQMGQPKTIQTKFGSKEKSYLKCVEFGDKYVNFWVGPQTADWAIGKKVEVAEVKIEPYNGKDYYNIVLPKKDDAIKSELAALQHFITGQTARVEKKLDQIIRHLGGEERIGYVNGRPGPFTEPPPDEELWDEKAFNDKIDNPNT